MQLGPSLVPRLPPVQQWKACLPLLPFCHCMEGGEHGNEAWNMCLTRFYLKGCVENLEKALELVSFPTLFHFWDTSLITRKGRWKRSESFWSCAQIHLCTHFVWNVHILRMYMNFSITMHTLHAHNKTSSWWTWSMYIQDPNFNLFPIPNSWCDQRSIPKVEDGWDEALLLIGLM